MHEYLRNVHERHGFLPPEELVETVGTQSDILDPYSVLISPNVVIGTGNVLYPNVVIRSDDGAEIHVGNDNIFYPGTYIFGSQAKIVIGSNNEFGVGGCTIRANMPNAAIVIGDGGRYSGGADIMGVTTLGSGSQVLGAITVQSCDLAPGGTFGEPDPDERAAVLKGMGLARGITLPKGQVINGLGDFAEREVEWQRDYHPKTRS